MPCPEHYHQHIGSDGKTMLACHPVSQKHTNPVTQRYHDMAAVQGKGKDIQVEQYKKETVISEERQKQIQDNLKAIRRNMTKLMNNPKLKSLLIPVSVGLMAYDSMVAQSEKLKDKAKSDSEKKQAEIYSDTVDTIVKDMSAINKPNPEIKDFIGLKADYKSKIDTLVPIIRKKGKSCPEYAQYRAYTDYMYMCDKLTEKVLKRTSDRGGEPTAEEKSQMLFGEKLHGRKVTGAKRPTAA